MSSSLSFKKTSFYLSIGIFFFLMLLVLWVIFRIFLSGAQLPSPVTQNPRSDFPDFRTLKTPSGKPPQFVVMSFDGSQSLEMWQNTRQFASDMKKNDKPIHFTYFISGVYFVDYQHAHQYQPPHLAAGNSQIGFSASATDTADRIQQLNAVISEGHEIASHANGHFNGGGWSQADWSQELNEFKKLVFTDHTDLHLSPNQIIGFRAPLLSRGNGLYPTLPKLGYLYDSSGVAKSPDSWPVQNEFGTWLIPMPEIPLSGTKANTIAMDYNFFSAQSQDREVAKRGTPLWDKFRLQTLQSYQNYFASNYNGNRAPVIIGHHFSLFNDGVYWQVMQDFAQDVCGQPEVYCVSFKELLGYLQSH